ncbi:MAG: cobalamin biosynthesis protein CobD, partial [Deltaproteobacteria bacterium]
VRTGLRDRMKHASPNSAHAEAFAAGALHVRLGGPVRYADGLREKPWLGREFPDPGPEQVHVAVRLIRAAAWVSMAVSLVVLWKMGPLPAG